MHNPTAVNIQGLTCHTVAVFRRQEDASAGNINGSDAPLKALKLENRISLLWSYVSGFSFRLNCTRGDAIDVHVECAYLARDGPGKSHQSPFGGNIVGQIFRAAVKCNRRNVDHFASSVFHHTGHHEPGASVSRIEIYVQDAGPLLLGHLQKRLPWIKDPKS